MCSNHCKSMNYTQKWASAFRARWGGVGGLLKTHVGAIAGLRRKGNLERLSVITACSAAHRTQTHTGWIQEKIAADVCFSPLYSSMYGRIFLSQISRMHWKKKQKTSKIAELSDLCLMLAACALQKQRSSCSLMRCHVFRHSSGKRASAGEILYSCYTLVCTRARAHLRTRTHTHVDDDTHACESACTQPPFTGSRRNHMFYKSPGEGEERNVTSSDISISAIKDTTALKVSRCAAAHVSDQRPRFITQIILNTP